MAGSNNFKVFDENVQNIMSDNQYSSDTARINGVSAGIAPSLLHNKLYRQVSMMAAAIGEVIKDQGNAASDADLNALKQAIIDSFASKPDMGSLSNLSTTNKTSIVAAINEAFQFANNGKIDIAGVIGSPALSSDTFATLKNYIQTDKTTLATNLTNKGQLSVGTETLAALVTKVANINVGKRWSSGTKIPDNASSFGTLSLSFPASVVLGFSGSASHLFVAGTSQSPVGSFGTAYDRDYTGSTNAALTVTGNQATVNSLNNAFNTSATYTWIAYE